MSLSIAIVGLPNVGKSTLFTALTRNQAEATSYPFSTIELNVGVVDVPDSRLGVLAKMVNPARVVPATVEFVDVAGLARGASTGAGLGNQFLANIREADAIVEVVRFFEDDNVMHVDGRVDPDSDAETIKFELVLADLATVERAQPRLGKDAQRDPSLKPKSELVGRMHAWLAEGHRAAHMEMTAEERALLYDLHLLTMKPMLYVANVAESQLGTDLTPIDATAGAGGEAGGAGGVAATGAVGAAGGVQPIPICAKTEAELADLEPEEAAEYLESLGLSEPGLGTLIRAAYRLLGLQSFFTAGEKEVKAWTAPIGAKAPQAAGVIHSDFERGFIKAEVVSYEDYVRLGGEKGARDAGRLRLEGKEYVVADGDVVHFKFNV
ncbi:MAG: YchF family ATPase [Coriobacteriia bacterium]|nr:YchF family ATPase [Coriobacteriia bacterium]